MRKQTYKNQTFSIPLEIAEELRTLIKQREVSAFVAAAIKKELDKKKESLKKAYLSANQDAGQKEASNEWESTIYDGSNDW